MLDANQIYRELSDIDKKCLFFICCALFYKELECKRSRQCASFNFIIA